jgi:hypothetical protein
MTAHRNDLTLASLENKMIVEDKILEYLDGSLGEHESAELLARLAVSPEKRALLEEHLRLKDILALGRKPYSVPLATERALAQRLPILSRPGTAPVPFGFRTALLGIRQWAGSRAIQAAVGVAALLAISTIAWLAMRPAASPQMPAAQQSYSANSAIQPGNSGAKVLQANNTIAKDLQDVRDANDADYATTNSASDATAPTTSHSVVTHSAATASETMPSETTASETMPSTTIDYQAIHPVTNFSQNDGLIPHRIGASTLSEIERGDIQSRNPITIGADFATGQSYLPQSASIAPQSPISGQFALTLDYDISDNFAIGLEAGQETYAALDQNALPSAAQSYSRVIYTSGIAAAQTGYFCLTSHYTIAPESGYPFRMGLAGGITYAGEPSAMATAGFSRVLSENLLLDLDGVFSGVWGPAGSPISIPASSIQGIVRQDIPQQKTFTSGVGIRAGLRYRL